MFKKDDSITAFELYEEFESYKRPNNISITTFCSEFQKRLSKVKASGTTFSEHVLAFRLLKAANLNKSEEQLVKATIDKMDYDSMVKQLKKAVNMSQVSSGMSGMKIKEEPIHLVQSDTFYGGNYQNNRKGRWNPEINGSFNKGRDRNSYDHRREDGNYNNYRREDSFNQNKPKKLRGRNPVDSYGKITKCRVCESINHWEKYCPDLSL